VDYVGTAGGKDVATAIIPGAHPQSAATAGAFAHPSCGYKNGRRPAPTAIIPSFHRPYDYDDSYIYQAVNSKTARLVGSCPVTRRPKTAPYSGSHSALAARPDARGRGAVNGDNSPALRARSYPGESVMTHTESGGGSK
jgi:hypothetical protein